MINELHYIFEFILHGFSEIWIYMLVSIPLAVAIRVSNAQQYIQRVFTGHPVKMIVLATVVGAFSPFCSCTVIPVIASLLVAGVPLSPVMSFWIASPSMDPEIFFLSVGLLGWQLAIVRVFATLALSLAGGFITYWLGQRGYFSKGILRNNRGQMSFTWSGLWKKIRAMFRTPELAPARVSQTEQAAFISLDAVGIGGGGPVTAPAAATDCGCGKLACSVAAEPPLWRNIAQESLSVTMMVVQFMLLAFFLEAIILRYVPQEAIINTVGENNPFAILLAVLVGIPVYTTNLTALPLIAGMLEQGMAPGAALAFLVAGPTTTLPAMAAVYGIAKRQVFAVYLGLALVGAAIAGYVYQLVLWL